MVSRRARLVGWIVIAFGEWCGYGGWLCVRRKGALRQAQDTFARVGWLMWYTADYLMLLEHPKVAILSLSKGGEVGGPRCVLSEWWLGPEYLRGADDFGMPSEGGS